MSSLKNVSADVLGRMATFKHIKVSEPIIPEIEVARGACGAIVTARFESGRKRVTIGEDGTGDLTLGKRALAQLIAKLQDIHSVMEDDSKTKEKTDGK